VFTVKGQGLDMHTANATFRRAGQSVTYKKYTYQDFAINGRWLLSIRLISSINNTAGFLN